MSDSSKDDFEVGYGKPPKSTQFKKGQSGNPGGRPKKSAPTVASQIANLMAKKYPTRVNGEVVYMTGEDLMAHRLMEKAFKGDPKAFEKVHQLANEHAAAEARRENKARSWGDIRVLLIDPAIAREEGFKEAGERVVYEKDGEPIIKECWPGYVPDDVDDVADVAEAAKAAKAAEASPVDTWNQPDNEETEDEAEPDDDDVGAYGLCIEHDI